jgi:energy-coupling factor transporter ATP-binding protein EcfA2
VKVTRIEIKNILGHEDLTIEPGAVTVLEGKNASGKTSALEAIRAALRGGEDPTLLRAGAEKGSVRLVLEDGTEVLRRWTRKDDEIRSALDVRLLVGGKVSTPRKVIDSLVDELGIDPLTILTCPPAKRAEYLAEVMPLVVTREELKAAMGRPVEVLKGSALDQIGTLRDLVFNERTGVNRSLKDKRTTAAQLRETVPAVEEAAENLSDLLAEKEALASAKETKTRNTERTRDAQLEERKRSRDQVLEELREALKVKVYEIEVDADRRIEAIRQEAKTAIKSEEAAHEGRVGDAREDADSEIEQLTAFAKGQLEEIEAGFGPRLEVVAGKIGQAEERSRVATQNAETRRLADRLSKEAESLEQEAERLTGTIDRLDVLKASLLEKLPIKGLEIRAGQVYADGIPFERVNRGRQIQVALKVAKLRAGKLGLIVVDNAEALDPETFQAFEAAAAATGLQFVVGRVTAGEFAVRTLPTSQVGEAA